MFFSRPPLYAMACMGLWLAQFVAHLVVLALHRPAPWLGPGWGWHLASLVCSLAVGVLLLLQLPRVLQWRPRLHPRPSPELAQERRRIARDLHDQIGSQLVNAMALLDAGDAAQARRALEQCMLDTRLLVDSMDGHDDALSDSLARLRYRLQPVLERRHIRLDWSVEWAEGMPSGACAHDLTCVVREALSNVLQHAGASEVSVSLAPQETPAGQAWHLCVADNGKGLPAGGLALTGLGTASMRERAARVGGTLQVTCGAQGGVVVRVVVPAGADRS